MFSDDENAILEKLHETMPGLSMDALALLWTAFRQEAIRKIAVERKPLDLGFVKIFPLPWRQNWKEVLMSRFRFAFSLLRFKNNGGKGPYQLAVEKFYHAMNADHLLALDRHKNFIHWSIECVPSNELTRRLDEHEHALALKLGDVDYTIQFMETLTDYMPDALKIYAWYNRRIAIPEAYLPGEPLMKILRPLEINPTPDQGNGLGPSTDVQADTPRQSPGTSTRIRQSETAQGPIQAEQPACTDAVPD